MISCYARLANNEREICVRAAALNGRMSAFRGIADIARTSRDVAF
jgi:hypothetical protein